MWSWYIKTLSWCSSIFSTTSICSSSATHIYRYCFSFVSANAFKFKIFWLSQFPFTFQTHDITIILHSYMQSFIFYIWNPCYFKPVVAGRKFFLCLLPLYWGAFLVCLWSTLCLCKRLGWSWLCPATYIGGLLWRFDTHVHFQKLLLFFLIWASQGTWELSSLTSICAGAFSNVLLSENFHSIFFIWMYIISLQSCMACLRRWGLSVSVSYDC